jgi:hypothetical protein
MLYYNYSLSNENSSNNLHYHDFKCVSKVDLIEDIPLCLYNHRQSHKMLSHNYMFYMQYKNKYFSLKILSSDRICRIYTNKEIKCKISCNSYEIWPVSWLGCQNFWLLAMRSRVRFPVLPWKFSLAGEDPHRDHGLGSLYNLGLRLLLVLHAHIYHHSHHRGNVTAPYGRPSHRSRLHFGHNQEGDHEVYMDMWWLWGKNSYEISNFYVFLTTICNCINNVSISCALILSFFKKITI